MFVQRRNYECCQQNKKRAAVIDLEQAGVWLANLERSRLTCALTGLEMRVQWPGDLNQLQLVAV